MFRAGWPWPGVYSGRLNFLKGFGAASVTISPANFIFQTEQDLLRTAAQLSEWLDEENPA